jgi:hypothetical protein
MRLYVNTRLHASNRVTVATVYQKPPQKSTNGTNYFLPIHFVLLRLFVGKDLSRQNLGSLDSSVFRL